jgi:hypothetical protein
MLQSKRPKFVLRNAADFAPVFVHLIANWTMPRIEVSVDELPALQVQHAQHRIAHLSDSRKSLGELLAGIVLLSGCYYSWMLSRGRGWTLGLGLGHLGLAVIAALGAWLAGKALGVAWTRFRLLVVLLLLRRRVVTGKGFTRLVTSRPDRFEPDRPVAEPALRKPAKVRAAGSRPHVVLGTAADMHQARHLVTRWRLPRIEIGVDGLPALDVQRAQDRIVRLSENCNCVLGSLLAAATLLFGSFYVLLLTNYDWVWMSVGGWLPMGMVLVCTPLAALIGWLLEIAWHRTRLLLVLRRLQKQLGRMNAGDAAKA